MRNARDYPRSDGTNAGSHDGRGRFNDSQDTTTCLVEFDQAMDSGESIRVHKWAKRWQGKLREIMK